METVNSLADEAGLCSLYHLLLLSLRSCGPTHPFMYRTCFPPLSLMKRSTPRLDTESVTMQLPGWSRSTTAEANAMRRLRFSTRGRPPP